MGYKLRKPIQLSKLASELALQWRGIDVLIEGVASLNHVATSDLTFCNVLPEKINGGVFITSDDSAHTATNSNGLIIVENPRLEFIKALSFLNIKIGFSSWELPADIHPTATIGQNVVIEKGCVVGPNTTIEHNVVLHAGTRVGEGSRIRSCSSVGGDGFGFERLEDGTPLRFPHLGGVVIGDNVEIGALNSVARGTLSDTIIEDGVKTDNLVHIAHNCQIGAGCLITACAELSGGVHLGENVWVGPNSSFMQKLVIGAGAVVGLGAVVTKNVEENTVVAGSPAKKVRGVS